MDGANEKNVVNLVGTDVGEGQREGEIAASVMHSDSEEMAPDVSAGVMYIKAWVATEDSYTEFLALGANNPLLRPWAELVAGGKVEDGKVVMMYYPEHISYIRPSDLDVLYELSELRYATTLLFGTPGWGTEGDDALIKDLNGYRKEIDRALELLQAPGVELENWAYDHRKGGTVILRFQTTDELVARQYQFDEVLMHVGSEHFEGTNSET
jgi:hypothetical protein